MDFSLHLHTCNVETSVRKVTNPFTGTPVEVPIDEGLTAAERDAVRAFLAEVGAGEPDADTYCKIDLPDGSIVSVAIGTLDQEHACVAFAVECSTLTANTVSFVFELARRGNMSIGSTVAPEIVALPSVAANDCMTRRWPMAQSAETPAQLRAWLRNYINRGIIV